MNVILNTPLLNSNILRQNFDNKIIIIFLSLILILVILGLLFLYLIRTYNSPTPMEEGVPQDSTGVTIYT